MFLRTHRSLGLSPLSAIRLALSGLLLLGLCCVSPCGRAANPMLDTLLTKIARLQRQPPALGRDTSLVLAVSMLTERMCNQHDPRVSAYLDTLRRTIRATGWNKGEGLLYRAQGKWADVSGNYKAALSFYTKAIAQLTRAGGDTYELAYTYVLAAFVLNNNGLVEDCKRYLNQALPLARQTKNTNNLCWILDFWGDYYFYENFGICDYPKALSYYKQVEALLPRATSPYLRTDNLHCLANCYLQLGNEAAANRYRQRAVALASATENRIVLFALDNDWAYYLLAHNQPARAVPYAQKALTYAEASGRLEMISRAEKGLSDAYRAAGNYQQALTLLERHQRHEDSLGRQSLQAEYVKLQARNDSQRQELTITRLEEESLLHTRNFLLVVLALVGLLVGGGIFMIRQLRRANRQLIAKNREIEGALVQGQVQERERVASELHDSLNTRVAAICWQLEALPAQQWPVADQQILRNILQMTNDLYADIRLISHNFIPQELETDGLAASLQRLVGRLNQNSRLRFYLRADLLETGMSLPLKHQLYAITLELVNNVIKHAHCQQAWLSLTRENDTLTLTVSDDGVGYAIDQTPEGAGLQNIQSRVKALHGQWQVTSKPGLGVNTTLQIPLAARPEESKVQSLKSVDSEWRT